MRILVAHNRYQYSGGEDAVARDEIITVEVVATKLNDQRS
jgi:hypothetical protein